MFCCLGAIAAIVVGAATGLGFWLLPVGIGLGLIADIKILRKSREEEKQEKSAKSVSAACCWLPSVRKKRIKEIEENITKDE